VRLVRVWFVAFFFSSIHSMRLADMASLLCAHRLLGTCVPGQIILLICFVWFVCKADAINPDEDDGNQAQTWEELAESNRRTIKALKWIMTGIMSLYLPISRIVFQVLACDPKLVAFAHEAGISEVQTGDCWAWDKYSLLFIFSLVMLAGFVIFVPIFTYKKIKDNIPVRASCVCVCVCNDAPIAPRLFVFVVVLVLLVSAWAVVDGCMRVLCVAHLGLFLRLPQVGSAEDPNIFYDEDGEPQPYTDAMFNEDVLKDPRQVKCPYQFLYKVRQVSSVARRCCCCCCCCVCLSCWVVMLRTVPHPRVAVALLCNERWC